MLFFMWCSVSFAKIGDIYICSMTQLVETKNDGSTNYKLQNFKFKRENKSLKFGSGGFFNDSVENVDFSREEYFYGGNDYGRFIYREGIFIYSQLLNHPEAGVKIVTVFANCDTF